MTKLTNSVEFVELHMDSSLSETTTSSLLTKGQDISNCVPFISWYCANTDLGGNFPDIWFTYDGGVPVINAQRTVASSNDMYIKGYVVEFNPDKIRVYQGSIPTTIGTSETFTTVTSSGTFDQSRTAMKFYYRTYNYNYNDRFAYHLIRGSVNSDGTTISFIKGYSSNTNYQGHYFMFESVNADFTVKHSSGSYTSNVYYDVPFYDWHNSFLIHSYTTADNSNVYDEILARAYLWGNGTVGIDRSDTGSTNYYNCQLIEFNNDATLSGVRYCPKISNWRELATSTYTNDAVFETYHIQPSEDLMISVTQNPTRTNYVSSASDGPGSFAAVWLTNSGTAYRIERAKNTQYSYPTYYLVDWAGQHPQYPDTGINPNPTVSGTLPVKSVENISTNIYNHVGVVHLSKGQDVSNCVVFKSGICTQTSNYSDHNRSQSLTYFRGNELYLERGDDGWDYPMELSVVEFWPNQVHVQQGTFIIDKNSTSTTVTVDAVNMYKTFLVFGHFYGHNAYGWGYSACRGYIVNSTTLSFSRATTSVYPILGSYYLVEDLAENWRVLHYNASSTSTVFAGLWPNDISNYYNTFSLMSYDVNCTLGYPIEASFQVIYHSPMGPARVDRRSDGYTAGVSTQSISFLNNNLRHTQQLFFGLSTGVSTVTQDLDSRWAGSSNITPILSSLNGTGSNDAANNNAIVSCYLKASYDSVNNQVTMSRKLTDVSSSTYNAVFVINWEGSEVGNLDVKSYKSCGSFVKAIDRYSYSGAARRLIWQPDKITNFSQCLPLVSYSVGDDTGSDPERFFYCPTVYADQRSVITEVFWEPNNPGVDIDITLIEFESDQVRVHSGSCYFAVGETSKNITIDSVERSKAFIIAYPFVSDAVGASYGSTVIAYKFNSDIEINFRRALSSGHVVVSWYVVECLQDQWEVSSVTASDSTNTSLYMTASKTLPFNRTICHSSTAVNYSSSYVTLAWFRYYPDYNAFGIYRVVGTRQTSGYTAQGMTTQFITFSESSNTKTYGFHYFFSGLETTITVNLLEEFDINRTVIWHADNSSRMQGYVAGISYHQSSSLAKAVLQNSTTVVLTRVVGGVSNDAWGFLYLVELPMPSHSVSGVVRERGSFVSRKLHLHNTNTGELLDFTTSTGIDGSYQFFTTYSGSSYLVCFDESGGEVYNGLIETDVYPEPIEGSFPYEEWL